MKDVAYKANKDNRQFGTRPAKIRKANVILCPYCYKPNILSIEGKKRDDYGEYWVCNKCNNEILLIS